MVLQAACREDQMDMEDRARAGRTTNMFFMSVTLDVNQFSGWLNTYAFCRVEGRADDAGRGVGLERAGQR